MIKTRNDFTDPKHLKEYDRNCAKLLKAWKQMCLDYSLDFSAYTLSYYAPDYPAFPTLQPRSSTLHLECENKTSGKKLTFSVCSERGRSVTREVELSLHVKL